MNKKILGITLMVVIASNSTALLGSSWVSKLNPFRSAESHQVEAETRETIEKTARMKEADDKLAAKLMAALEKELKQDALQVEIDKQALVEHEEKLRSFEDAIEREYDRFTKKDKHYSQDKLARDQRLFKEKEQQNILYEQRNKKEAEDKKARIDYLNYADTPTLKEKQAELELTKQIIARQQAKKQAKLEEQARLDQAILYEQDIEDKAAKKLHELEQIRLEQEKLERGRLKQARLELADKVQSGKLD